MPDEQSEKPEAPGAPETDVKANRRTIVRAAGVVSVITVLSRILGLWRDRLMAAAFGASWVNDAFQIAFLLPNMTRRLFGEGSLASAFVPVFSERLATNRKEAAFQTASVLLSRLALGLTLACALLIAVSIGVRSVFGLDEKVQLTLQLAEIMLGYCVLINVAAGLMGILNSLGHFAAPAAAPVLLNVCMIAACLYGLDWLGTEPPAQITVVAWAVMLGGVLQLLILIAPALARGFRYRFSLDKSDDGYAEVMRNFAPVIFGVAIFQINLLMDQLIARTLIPGDGPVTMLAYGNRLVQLPWALFSLSLATAALPMLSRHWAAQRMEAYSDALSTAVRHTLFMALPSAVGLCVLSEDLVRLFYGTGEFLQNNGDAVRRTGKVVLFFSAGLCFYSLNAVLARAIYATKDTRTPTRATIAAVAVNFTLNLVFVLATPMREAGLALASAISGAVQTLILLKALAGRLPPSDKARLATFGGILAAGIGLGAVLSFIVYSVLTGPSYKDRMESFLAFIAAAVAAALPLWAAGRFFFQQHLKPVTPTPPANPDLHVYGVPEERWPRDLAFCHSLYALILSSLVMGLLVWSVRESLPPPGGNFGLIFQRAIVPVGAGVLVFAMAASGFGSREYRELVQAFGRKKKESDA
jgi:putative peptidoglycan lipid II flippase